MSIRAECARDFGVPIATHDYIAGGFTANTRTSWWVCGHGDRGGYAGKGKHLESEDILAAVIAHFEDAGLWPLYQCLLHPLLNLHPYIKAWCDCSTLCWYN